MGTIFLVIIITDEELQDFRVFVGRQKWTSSDLGGPRNVSVDLKYDVLCL